MLKIFTDKRYSGFVWHLLFAGVFIGLSLIFIEFTEGIMWYLISSVLRIIFGIAILIVSTRLFGRKASDILSFRKKYEISDAVFPVLCSHRGFRLWKGDRTHSGDTGVKDNPAAGDHRIL